MQPSPHRHAGRDLAVALLLAFVLMAAWTVRGWSDLAALHLPDTDDAARLQQVRDWLAGQPYGDLAQHRLGATPGLEMHWSRLPDLVPAGLIAIATPLIGVHAAELGAVILWPGLLFAAALCLIGAIARRLDVSSTTAILLAALAYPATTIFLPGRIDHHNLQLVLVLLLALCVMGQGSRGSGVIAALALTASLVIGLETAPLLAVAGAALIVAWVFDRPGSADRLAGFGLALPLALAGAAAMLRTSGWSYPACDGFTAIAWRAAQTASLAPCALALLTLAIPLKTNRRATLAALAGVGSIAAVTVIAPQCLHPYGQVDPALARLWLANVGEAKPLFAAPPATAIAYGGLLSVGLLATLVVLFRRRTGDWAVLAALIAVALAITLVQLRGAYTGAMLAAPALAVMIAAARARGLGGLIAAWAAGTGTLYPIAASAMYPPDGAPVPECAGREPIDRLAALPEGRLLAPLDLGAYALAGTRHQIIAAPYHRNNRGNRLFYDMLLGSPEAAAEQARRWKIDYVAVCTGQLGDLVKASRTADNLAASLAQGRVPAWLKPVGKPGAGLLLFRVASKP